MPILNQIRQLFARSNSSPTALSAVSEPAVVTRPEPLIPESTNPFPTLTSAATETPAWLADEDRLRDEGVFFGVSDARPDELISRIRHEFMQQTAPLEQTLDQYNEKIGELNLFIEQHENQIGELRYKLDELARRKPIDHQLPRTLAGLILSTLMGVGTFFLVDETLRPALTENRWISVGVFLAGMFGLFSRASLSPEANAPITARRLIEEVGLPLATSLFVFAQALKTQSLGNALALGLFVFFLFLRAGKLFLSNLTLFWSDLRAVSQNRRFTHDRLVNTPNWETETSLLRAGIDRLRVQKWQIIAESNRHQAALTRLTARRDGLIKLFESEFNLARSLRDRLTDEQRQAILAR